MNGAIASGLWPTVSANKLTLSGELVNADGTEWDGISKPHSKTTGRPVTTALADAVKMWLTPNARDHKDTGANINWEKVAKKSKLAGAVMWPTPRSCSAMGANFTENTPLAKFPNLETVVARRELWPTPSSNNGTGGATGLAGGSGNRKELYKLLGEEEGKKMGCLSLNPYWVEWLMGYPVGWTALEDSVTPSSRKSRKR